MRIIETSPDQLALQTRPNWVIVTLAVVLLALGSVLATSPAKLTELKCQRRGPSAGSCEIVETRLLSRETIVRFPLRMLTGASARTHQLGASRYARLELGINDGKGPFFFAWYGEAARAEQDAARVSEYLDTPEDLFLRLANDKRPFFWGLATALAGLGALLLWWGSQSLESVFHRVERTVTIRRKRPLSRTEVIYPFEAIADLQVAGLRNDHLLLLVMKDGRRIAISASTDIEAFGGPRKVRSLRQATAERIRSFCTPALP